MNFPSAIQRALLFCLVLIVSGCDNKTPAEHLEDAQSALAEGEANVALIELKNALNKESDNVLARTLLGQIRLQQGDVETALKDLQRAVDLGAEDDATMVAYLRSKNILGDHLAVIGELEDKSGLSPEFAVVLGEAYLAVDDLANARQQFQQGLHLPEGLLGISQVAYYENDPERAYKYIEQAIDKSPDNRAAWLFKAELELAMEDTAASLASFEKAGELPGARISSRLGIVRAHLVAEDMPAASQAVERLISAAKVYPYAHYLKGLIAFRQQDFINAERALQEVERLAGDDPDSMRLMAAVKYELGEKDASERLLRRYLQHDSADISSRKLLARIMSERSQHAEVVELLQPFATQQADPQVWAMLGNALMQTGETSSATEAFESAVQIAPDMAVFRNQLALSLLSSGDQERAMEQLTSAVELDDDPLQSEYLLVLVKIRDGDYSGAQEITQGLLERDAGNPVGHHLKGLIALSQEDDAAAMAAFTQALEQDSAYFPAAHTLAQMAIRDGDLSTARGYYQQLADAEGGHERASLALAELDLGEQKFDRAVSRLQATVMQFPESTLAHTALARLQMATGQLGEAQQTVQRAAELGGDRPDILFLQADIALRSGERETAEQAGEKLQALAASFSNDARFLSALGALQLRLEAYTSARQNLLNVLNMPGADAAPLLVNLVKLELADRNPRRAQKYLDRLLESGAKASEDVALLQGDVYLAANRRAEALQQYTIMSRQGSRNATLKAGMLLLQDGKYTDVDELLSAWLEDQQDDVGVQSLLASAKVQLGDLQAAKAQYEAMMPTNNPTTLNNLAWIYLTEGDRRALDLAQKAHKIAPDNPDIQDTLGWILVQQDRAEEALPLLQASARARSDQGAVQYHLAMAYLQLGEEEQAADALQKAIELGDFEELEAAREALQRVSQS